MGLASLIKNKKGSVTVYLLISFTALIIAVGVLSDLARIKAAQYQLKKSANSAARSVMAHYDSGLRSAYGLYVREELGASDEFAGYLTDSLNLYPEDFMLAVRYEGSSVKMDRSIDQREILKGQILEDMKYKAPVDFFLKMADCFRKISGLTDFFKNSNDMRRSVSLINNFLAELNETHQKIKERSALLVQNRKKIQRLQEELERASAERASKIQDDISELNQECQKAENEIQKEFQKADRVKIELELEITKLEAKFISVQAEKNDAKDSDKLLTQQDTVNRHVDDAIEAYKKDLTSISVQFETAKAQFKKLREDQKRLDTTGIGIEAAVLAHQRITQEEEVPKEEQRSLVEEVSRLRELHRDMTSMIEAHETGEKPDSNLSGSQADRISEVFDDLFKKMDEQHNIYNLRDELYIDQYVLTRFSNLTTGTEDSKTNPYSSHEAEYICYGSKGVGTAMGQLYFMRFALDTAAYFAFTKEPVELIQRMLYALVMGGLQAVTDTYHLVAEEKPVPIGNMVTENPLKDVTLNYTDHLRILFFLQQDEAGKLSRMTEVMAKKSSFHPEMLFSNMRGEATAAVKLWFMPALGFGNMEHGPFGTTVRRGVCYITKETGYTY